MEPRVVKLIKNGTSQVERLPADFLFEGEEVYIIRNEVTGDVVLSLTPSIIAYHQCTR
jgi:antitoxin VapB